MNDINQIIATVEDYFRGTYEGNGEKLKKSFHHNARITGFVKDEYFDWSLTEFIDRVTTGISSAAKGDKYDKEIILIDKTNNLAMVKARVLVSTLIFTDYITLLKINGKWLIRHKSFTA